MNGDYTVQKFQASEVEQAINAATNDGWEVVAAYVARFIYALGGEYQAKEVQVIFRRRATPDPGAPA
jgi:hypothetical protein